MGGIVNFTDLSTNDPNKWIWNFGACGETSSEQNPSHHFTREGIHRVTLIAYNDNGYDVETKESFINVNQRKSLVDDIEGNIYPTVEIGDQWWMAENLKSTKFNNGADIPLVTSNTHWDESTTPAYRWYDNDQTQYGNTYGALYNWHTVNTGKLCPSGWHVPTDSDWKELETALGMLPEDLNAKGERGSYIGSKLAGNADLWRFLDHDFLKIESNPHFGSSGFEALPGGGFIHPSVFLFLGLEGYEGFWWSSSDFDSSLAWFRYLYATSKYVIRSRIPKQSGLSVRCVKD